MARYSKFTYLGNRAPPKPLPPVGSLLTRPVQLARRRLPRVPPRRGGR